MKKVAIIGAGISGLYLANLMEQDPSIEYKIFEKNSNFDLNEGYGIQLSVNSIKLLNKIGFKNLPVAEMFFPKKVNFFQAKNHKKICDIDLNQFNDEQNRYTTIKRSILIKLLLKNIPREKIKQNIELDKVDVEDQINVYLSDKSNEVFDYLVISDGVFSKSKSIICNRENVSVFNNSIALRGLISDLNIFDISIFMGAKFHYVIYPINQSNEYNFIAIIKKKFSEKEILDEKLFKSEYFLEKIKNFIVENSLVDLSKVKNFKTFPVFISDKLELIDKKNIFLSGDALFAFPPSFAQGASQSIETSQVIFEDIKNNTDQLYKNRIKRIKSINWKSKVNEFFFQLQNPLIVFLRNIILKYLSKNKNFLESYLGKIYRN